MGRKIAVAVIFGIGSQTEHFANDVSRELIDRCYSRMGTDAVINAVYWADAVREDDDLLNKRMVSGGSLHYPRMRRFLQELMADALAYQPTPHDRRMYDHVHALFAQTLRDLARAAGEAAPLVVIAHGLGTVIASNYFYDLQNQHKGLIAPSVLAEIANTPLERGETLALLYTIGSPLALWNRRYPDFGTPIQFPAPQIKEHYPDMPTEWINFYDPQDVLGYPLKSLNNAHWQVVSEDRAVSTGRVIENLTPLSPLYYGTAKAMIQPIADRIVDVWGVVNRAAYAQR